MSFSRFMGILRTCFLSAHSAFFGWILLSIIVVASCYDFGMAIRSGISIWLPMSIALNGLNYQHLALFLTLFFVAPVFFSIIHAYTPWMHERVCKSNKNRRLWVAIHLLFSVVLTLMPSMGLAIENLSGPTIIREEGTGNSQIVHAVTTIGGEVHRQMVRWSVLVTLGTILSLLAFLLPIIQKNLKKMERRLQLSNSQGGYSPIWNLRDAFVAGSSSPCISLVKTKMRRLLKKISKHAKRSRNVVETLRELYDTVSAKVKQFFFANENVSNEWDIEFYSGTSRAIEVAIGRPHKKQLRFIVLSPFEHKTEEHVCNWCSYSKRNSWSKLPLPENWSGMDWEDLKRIVINGFVSEIRANYRQPNQRNQSGRFKVFSLVISETFFLTGCRIPVDEIINGVRSQVQEEFNDVKIFWIVDGAHSSSEIRFEDEFGANDSYVVSGHKWLLSPNPIGILFRKRQNVNQSPAGDRPYDCWYGSTDSPKSTLGIEAPCGLIAGLDTIQSAGELFEKRPKMLREQFVETLDPQKVAIVTLVGVESTSSFCCLRPKTGHKWPSENLNDLTQWFFDQGWRVNVFLSEDAHTMLRVSIPFYANLHQVNQLATTINNAISTER